MNEDLRPFLLELAALAAEPAKRTFRQPLVVENKRDGSESAGGLTGEAAFDPVTETDKAIEIVLRDAIAERYPTHGLLGEEFGQQRAESAYQWVLDPIDGTRAFVAGWPTWGTLVGLTKDGRATFGLMSQPITGEVYVAGPGGAALHHHDGTVRPLRARETVQDGLVLSTTSPDLFNAEEREVFDQIRADAKIVRYGGDCYAYAQVAAGRVDAVVESGLAPYDIVALVPIVEQAGGIVTTWDGERPESGGRIIAAANATVHGRLLEKLAGLPD